MVAAVGDGGEAGERSSGSSMGQSSLLVEVAFIAMVLGWVGDVEACAQGWDGMGQRTDGRTGGLERDEKEKEKKQKRNDPRWSRLEWSAR